MRLLPTLAVACSLALPHLTALEGGATSSSPDWQTVGLPAPSAPEREKELAARAKDIADEKLACEPPEDATASSQNGRTR